MICCEVVVFKPVIKRVFEISITFDISSCFLDEVGC